MNQNVKSLFVAGAVLATALSCTKNESDPANPITCRLVSMQILSPNKSEERMITDDNGNILRLEYYVNGNLYSSSTLVSGNGKVVITDSTAVWGDIPAKQDGTTTYVLGSDGNAVSRYFNGGGGEWADSTYYTYDAGGYLTKMVKKLFKASANAEKEVEQTYTHTYVNTNGICTQEDLVAVGAIGNYRTKSNLEYYETPAGISYQVPNMVSRAIEFPFLGKSGKALLKTITYFDGDNNKESGVYSYTYDYDASGKPSKCNIKTVNGGSPGFEATLGFGYNCN